MPQALNIAVLGCCHGELNQVYRSIAQRSATAATIDLLIIGGDFQAVRNHADLSCMSVPAKYKRLGDFHRYYSGEAKAPVLTIFVGGNHESSAYMQELYHGGWVAPNIYYLGNAGIVLYRGLRIAGISGIWQKDHYLRGYQECPPYTPSMLRSVYHVRQYEVQRLLAAHLARPGIDIFLSHDWPRGIEQHGDTQALLKAKPFFKKEVARNDLGSPANETLLEAIKPRYWFSAHLHVRFEAEVVHRDKKRARSSEAEKATSAPVANPDEIVLDLDEDSPARVNPDEIPIEFDENEIIPAASPKEIVVGLDDDAPAADLTSDKAHAASNPDEFTLDLGDEAPAASHGLTTGQAEQSESLADYKKRVLERLGLPAQQTTTRFLALDKCLPGRHYLEFFSIDTDSACHETALQYDATWLATTRALAPYFSTGAYQCPLPDPVRLQSEVAAAHAWLHEREVNLRIPLNFENTAPAEDPLRAKRTQVTVYENPQTRQFVDMLEIPYPFIKKGSGWEARPIRHP